MNVTINAKQTNTCASRSTLNLPTQPKGFRDYTLLPIFPLRMFRHRSVFIRNDRGIKRPEDLRGRKVATPGYSSTSLTWIRGILEDEYGISPKDVQWIVARKDSSAKDAGKASKQENVFPKGVPIELGPEGQDESDSRSCMPLRFARSSRGTTRGS